MTLIDKSVESVLERACEGRAPSRAECAMLLEWPAASPEATLTRGAADALMRRRFGNEAILLGQVGVEIDACPGMCLFCSFAREHTRFQPAAMGLDEVIASARAFAESGDLYALFLMTMHEFDFDRLAETVVRLRELMPQKPQIVVNVGDFDRAQAEALAQAGVNGAYHVLRLREGADTALDPEARLATVKAIRAAGLDWYYCCEPVGPEHGPEELVEQMFLGVELGCFQHAAMRRVYIPGSPLAGRGQISDLRLGQVTAVVALASMACPETQNIAVHEPNLIGLTAGANVVYAESGANPRDTEEDTSTSRGRDVTACKRMLYEAGFEHLLAAPGERRPLGSAYLD